MHLVERTRIVKTTLITMAIVIAIVSLLTSNYLIRDLQQEEQTRMEVWAEAMRSLNDADETTDMNLVLKVINGNNTIPVIVLDKKGNVQTHRNLARHFKADEDTMAILQSEARKMKDKEHVIQIYPSHPSDLQNIAPQQAEFIEICYDESLMLRRLAIYPYVQLAIVVIFVLIAIYALFTSMRAEQNKVWVGLSKETAHQLGTPISSLMAWTEVLRENYPDDVFLPEMSKDVKRLERIAERFSKIGSIPELKPEDLCAVVKHTVDYMERRTSHRVKITCHMPNHPVMVKLISSLFEWVLENLCKNAVDAMSGSGFIDLRLTEGVGTVAIEVSDTGKGILKSQHRSVFQPGFTTKARGWGLGLSLAKRIVEEYHKGRIYVKWSEVGKGTTFRIDVPTTG